MSTPTPGWSTDSRGRVSFTEVGPGHLLASAPEREGYTARWVTVRGDQGWTRWRYRAVPTQGQHRVVTTPVEVEDWKGVYTLDAGLAFTVTEDEGGETVEIERDGLLSGSMGGTIARVDLLANTREG